MYRKTFYEMITEEPKNETFASLKIEDVEEIDFRNCSFKNVDFTGSELKTVGFIECNYDNCDFSNSKLNECSIIKTEFQNCKMTGTDFSETYFHETEFVNSNMTYTNFTETRLKKVSFKNNKLENSSFNYVKLDKVVFESDVMIDTEWFGTNLKNIDLSLCQIDGMVVDRNLIQGLIVNEQQAISLSKLLGIVVKEEN